MANLVYLDHNATTPLKPAVIAAISAELAACGNASSIHAAGRAARTKIEKARASVAKLAGAAPTQIVFTSGATEANNTVLRSFKTPAVAATEHPSVRETALSMGGALIPVLPSGLIDMEAAQRLLAEGRTDLVSVMLVNNETGVVQDIAAIAALCHTYGAQLHTDAVQAAGRMPVDMAVLGVDYLTLSAHKFGGPQGTGAIVSRTGAPDVRLLTGGGQERRQRAGTENVPAIVGFGVACDLAIQDMADYQRLGALRDAMEQQLHAVLPQLHVFGSSRHCEEPPATKQSRQQDWIAAPATQARNDIRICNTSCFALPHIDAATQLMALDLAGFCVSNGSACSSGTVKPSPVLEAMGVDAALAKCALRVSLGWNTTADEINAFTGTYIQLAKGWA